MIVVYNDTYYWHPIDNQTTNCHLTILAPIRSVDDPCVHLIPTDYWLVIIEENQGDTGISTTGGSGVLINKVLYTFDIPYDKVIWVERYSPVKYGLENYPHLTNLITWEYGKGFNAETALTWNIMTNEELDYLRTGKPVIDKLNKSEAYTKLYEKYSKYL